MSFNSFFQQVSEDHSVRIWDLDTFDQLYQFDTVGESASCVVYHPVNYVIACGFKSGTIRIFGNLLLNITDKYKILLQLMY